MGKFSVQANDIDKSNAPAVQIDFPSVFFRHLDRISKTASEITDSGKPSIIFFQIEMLESLIFPWTGGNDETRKITYQGAIKRPGQTDEDISRKTNDKILSYCNAKMKALLVQALNAGILPGFKPPEKKIGLKVFTEDEPEKKEDK